MYMIDKSSTAEDEINALRAPDVGGWMMMWILD
jgi:hypothetical protein